MLRAMLNKEDYKKVVLIKKYAKIRIKRFWREWGITKFEAKCFATLGLIFGGLYLAYILGSMF